MSNQSKDIQEAGSDTRPPMLNMTDFESWQQRIRLYCKGKYHGEYILQSTNEGPFKMGWCRDEIATGTDGPYLSLERDRVVADLSQAEKDRLKVDIRTTNIILQGFPRDIYKLINHNTDAKDIWDNVKMLLEGSELTKDNLSNVSPHQYPSSSSVPPQPSYIPPVTYQPQFTNNTQLDTGFSPADELLDNLTKQVAVLDQQYKTQFPETNNQLRTSSNIGNQATVQNGNRGAQYRAGNANAGQGKPIKCYNCNRIGHIARNRNQPKQLQNSNVRNTEKYRSLPIYVVIARSN
ncbi:retrovirus-related pol polyprotein from transposon TNT 1-94 [Tanacetum coccineum]